MATIAKRTDAAGATHYQVRIRLRGYPPQVATFARLTDAKRWAVQTEAAMRERRHFKTVEAQKHTLGDLCERYIRDVLPTKPKAQSKQTAQLNWWQEQLGGYTLADVTPTLIAEARDKLAKTPNKRGPVTQPATVVRYLAALSHAYTVAVKEWGWIEDNPLRNVRKPREPRGRIRFLSDDERERLLTACRESTSRHLHTVVVLALSAGMRSQEITGMRRDQLDLNQRRITLTDTKNREIRVVPLAGYALELMRDHVKVRRLDTPLVFPGIRKPQQPVDLRTAFLAVLAKAGIENFTFHDLRHSAASYLAMNGASLAEIAEVLGHKTLAMVKRYAHLSEAHTAGVVWSG